MYQNENSTIFVGAITEASRLSPGSARAVVLWNDGGISVGNVASIAAWVVILLAV